MEKLIELLNKYEKKAVVHWYERYGQDVLMCRYIKDNFEFYTDEAVTIAISKYYGFIQWLVENDKIDTRKIDEDRLETIQYSEKERITIYDWLLMFLAIQDEPINFLISTLK